MILPISWVTFSLPRVSIVAFVGRSIGSMTTAILVVRHGTPTAHLTPIQVNGKVEA